MDFAAEPVMDVFQPPRTAAGRPAAQRGDDAGPSFAEHLETVTETLPAVCTGDATQAQTAVPASSTGAEAKSEGQPQTELADITDVAPLGGAVTVPVAPIVAPPVVVQIAAQQRHQPQQPTPPAEAPAAALASPTPASPAPTSSVQQQATETPSAPATIVADAANAAAPDNGAPVSTPAQPAPQANLALPAPPAQATAQQSTAQIPITIDSPPPGVGAVIATAIAATPEVPAQVVQRAPKTTGDLEQTRQAPETPRPLDAPQAAVNVAARAQPTRSAAAAQNVIVEATTPAPAQTGTSDAPQSAQTTVATATAAQAGAQMQQASADAGAQRAAPAPAQVAREIIRRFDGGSTSFELRLDPPELGRVEVRVEVSRDHRVTAVIAADSPQALTELARHARDLEQQLQSAGLQLSDNGLSFDLRQGAQSEDSQASGDAPGRVETENTATDQSPTRTARPIGLERWRGVRVDMMV